MKDSLGEFKKSLTSYRVLFYKKFRKNKFFSPINFSKKIYLAF